MGHLMPYRPQVLRSAFGLGREFERAIDQLLGDAWRGEETSGGAWVPPVDIHHTDEAIEVRADLPGMSRDEVDLRAQGNTLTISGERKRNGADSANAYLVERKFGKFERSFTLPTELDATKAAATYRDGVLHVSIPRAEQAKPRRLQIKAG